VDNWPVQKTRVEDEDYYVLDTAELPADGTESPVIMHRLFLSDVDACENILWRFNRKPMSFLASAAKYIMVSNVEHYGRIGQSLNRTMGYGRMEVKRFSARCQGADAEPTIMQDTDVDCGPHGLQSDLYSLLLERQNACVSSWDAGVEYAQPTLQSDLYDLLLERQNAISPDQDDDIERGSSDVQSDESDCLLDGHNVVTPKDEGTSWFFECYMHSSDPIAEYEEAPGLKVDREGTGYDFDLGVSLTSV
jgi:hypothetical protein